MRWVHNLSHLLVCSFQHIQRCLWWAEACGTAECVGVCLHAYMCVCISGSVVSSDKRRAGSTSLQRKENPSSGVEGKGVEGVHWWKGRLERQQWVAGEVLEDSWGGGRFWRNWSRFGWDSWPHLVRMQICDNATGGGLYKLQTPPPKPKLPVTA